MSTWIECHDGEWVNLDTVNVISVRSTDDVVEVLFESAANFVVHSRHDSIESADATIGRFLAASGTRCLRRGV